MAAQKSPYVSSHVSIFPEKTAPTTMTEGMKNNRQFSLANESFHYMVPLNFYYYMREGIAPQYRWHPPEGLCDMLSGKSAIIIDDTMNTPPPEYVGWIDYAHSDGEVYSGTLHGFVVMVEKFTVSNTNSLIEFFDHGNPSPAKSCESLEDKNQLNVMAKRAEFLSKIAGMHENFTRAQINEFLQRSGTTEQMEKMFGSGNYVTLLGERIQFKKIQN